VAKAPQRFHLVEAEQAPASCLAVACVYASVERAAHPLEQAHGLAHVDVFAEHARAEDVDDLQLQRLARRRLGGCPRRALERDEIQVALALASALGLERRDVRAGALRLTVENPFLGDPLNLAADAWITRRSRRAARRR
jgi:hypothetical protein